jgi:transcriptional regulator with XRE-family HTH domain
MPEILRRRRTELALSQADLAATVGLDKRQIRRYEAGEAQPTLQAASAIARALGLSLDELAGLDVHRIDVTGDWWACWQSWHNGVEVVNPHEARITARSDALRITAVTRGTPVDDGGYLWEGDLRVFDNEALMGWYTANEGAIRSRGTMYFVVHQHGQHMTGRWVGLSHDGPIISGWSTMARTREKAVSLMDELRAGDA